MPKRKHMTFAFKIHHRLAFEIHLHFKSETYKSKPAILSTLKNIVSSTYNAKKGKLRKTIALS